MELYGRILRRAKSTVGSYFRNLNVSNGNSSSWGYDLQVLEIEKAKAAEVKSSDT